MPRTILFAFVLPLSLLVVIGMVAGCGGGANADISVSFKADVDEGPVGPVDPPVDDLKGPAGTFVGRVSLTDAFAGRPALIEKGASLAIAKDEICSSTSVPDETLVVDGAGGVRDVFIFMDKVPKKLTKLPLPEKPVIFDQKLCTFLPHAMVVRVGQKIQVWNSDPAAHNTHTRPKINSEFNSVVNAGDQSGDKSFQYKKPEKQPISVVCDFHGWMKAYHFPVDHPFATVTKADGTFEIKDIPPGKYRFKVWHSGKYLERKVEVVIKAGSPTKMDFNYSAQKLLAAK